MKDQNWAFHTCLNKLSIFRGLTVYENLLGIAQIIKKKATEQKEIVEKLMAEFSITHLRDVKSFRIVRW